MRTNYPTGPEDTTPHQYHMTMEQHWKSLQQQTNEADQIALQQQDAMLLSEEPLPEYGQKLDEDSWDTGCHGFEYSSFFFVVFTLIMLAFFMYAGALFTRRQRNGGLLYGFDILYCIMFITAFIRLTPIVWNNVQQVWPESAPTTTQTECKIMAFTTIGTTNVIGFILVCLVMYAWIGARSSKWSHADIDRALRRHLGWFVLFVFALEGATGMAPAIYTDIGQPGTGMQCSTTLLDGTRNDDYLVYITLMALVIPYVIPFILVIYPLVDTWRNSSKIEDDVHRSGVRTIVGVTSAFIACYSPATLLSLLLYPLMIKGHNLPWSSVCGIENFCHFVQDSFYVAIPIIIILNDPELGKNFPGKVTLTKIWAKVSCACTQRLQGRNLFNSRRLESSPDQQA